MIDGHASFDLFKLIIEKKKSPEVNICIGIFTIRFSALVIPQFSGARRVNI